MNDRLTLARENIKLRLKDFAAASAAAPDLVWGNEGIRIPVDRHQFPVPNLLLFILHGLCRFPLVPCNVYKFGYSRLNLIRASEVVNCQLIFLALLFRFFSHAAMWLCMAVMSGMRRSRHWPFKTLSSISAMFSQLPCFGV